MGKSTTQKTKQQYMPGQKAGYQQLLGGAMGQISPDYYQQLQRPYTGQFTAPQTAGEQYGTDWMRNVLQGGYDPRTSDFYQGLRTQAQEDLQRALTGTRQSAAMGGMLASTPRIGQEAQLQRQMTGDLSTLLGGMYEAERGRQQQVLPQYMQAAGLPRQIEQAELAGQYNEFLRQMQALGLPLQTALQLLTQGATGQKTTTQQPWYTGLGEFAGALIGSQKAGG